ncbi:MAG: hypothetical protein FWF60_02860 [Oscillospiraceae bacterium]|nr:hypothetical protein [Oscillospiraceae bacterium]
MEKKWSRLDTFFSILASIATVVSIAFGMLYTNAKNATVQIDQPNGPIEVKLVDFPDVYGDLKAENERLKAELKQKENQAGQANVTENVQTPAATIPQIDGTYLFTLVPKWQSDINILLNPSSAPYAIAGNAEGGINYNGRAAYILSKKYQKLTGIIVPSNDIKVDRDLSFTIWADGGIIYGSPQIYRESDPIYFTCSVEGANEISFETTGGPLILREFILS